MLYLTLCYFVRGKVRQHITLSYLNSGGNIADHFSHVGKMVTIGSKTQREIEDIMLFSKANMIMEFGSLESIKQCVKKGKGLGMSLLPRIAVEEGLKRGYPKKI